MSKTTHARLNCSLKIKYAVQPGAHLLHAPCSPLFAVMQARNYTPLRSSDPYWASMLPATINAVLPAQPFLSNAMLPAQPFDAVLPAQPSLSNTVLPAQPYLFSKSVLPVQPSLSNAVLRAQPSLFIPDIPSPGGQEKERTLGESPLTTAPFTVTSSWHLHF